MGRKTFNLLDKYKLETPECNWIDDFCAITAKTSASKRKYGEREENVKIKKKVERPERDIKI